MSFSGIKLIIAIAALAGVIIAAAILLPRLNDKPTETQQQKLEEIMKNKEKVDEQKQESAEKEDKPNEAQKPDSNESDAPSGSGKDENSAVDEPEDQNEPILAPDFTVYTRESEPVKFSEKTGKPMILNFWATWCGPCQSEHPYFQKAYDEYGDEIEFMMINPTDGYNDTQESVDKFIEKHGYTFPVYMDLDSEAHYIYGINAFPTTVLIDKDGYFIGGYSGALTQEMLDMLVEMLLD